MFNDNSLKQKLYLSDNFIITYEKPNNQLFCSIDDHFFFV